MSALVLGAVIWYRSRPKPPVPPQRWNATALIAQEPPQFDSFSLENKKLIRFSFMVENTTSDDYELPLTVKLMVRYKDGSLGGPITQPSWMVWHPAFIPAKQRGHLLVLHDHGEVPDKSARESEKEYHERFRGFLEERINYVNGFVLYDDINHFQINLPRWRSEPLPEPASVEKKDSVPK